jgi:hypothetical protein
MTDSLVEVSYLIEKKGPQVIDGLWTWRIAKMLIV